MLSMIRTITITIGVWSPDTTMIFFACTFVVRGTVSWEARHFDTLWEELCGAGPFHMVVHFVA